MKLLEFDLLKNNLKLLIVDDILVPDETWNIIHVMEGKDGISIGEYKEID
ncbi:MAG: hypothetical protein K0S01_1058 [Herbinix sp.]|nr:hypothetical protein [Herbinix sp.]